MENPLHEAHEHIEHLEHRPASRLKVVVTVTILLVTMLTTLAGVMAAIWSARESDAQRARQQATAESLKAGLEATAQQSAIDQGIDDVTEAQWRSAFLNADAALVESPSLIKQLRAQADAATKAADEAQGALPQGADYADYAKYVAKLRQPALVQEELAKAHAHESEGWLTKNNGALAVVSMLALSLFLLGLTLTINNRHTQIGFTVLSIVMTVVAGARLGQIAASPIVVASESCIDRYAEAGTDASAGELDKATATLRDVVADCSRFEDAWLALANDRFADGSAPAMVEARDAYQRALDVADAKSAELYNDLGYAQTLAKDFSAAKQNLDKAAELAPENPVIMMSRAELAIARGDRASAEKFLDEGFKTVADLGPYFRNQFFFASLRTDRIAFATAGIKGKAIDDFFLTTRQAEAVLDAPGMTRQLDSHGASITDLVFKKSATKLGEIADFVTIGFAYHGLEPGDVISLRFYGNDRTTFDLTASLTAVASAQNGLIGSGTEVPDRDFRLGLSNTGETTLEVYLNGVSQGEVSLTI
jgi:tetratricopeptide (TPR) repeat protein